MGSEHYKQLARKRVHVASLIFNEEGHVLLVKPTYKDVWSLPGGAVDEHESPLQGGIRELKEETGIVMPALAFVSIQFIEDRKRGDALFFMFTTDIIITNSILQEGFKVTDEIAAVMFVPLEEIKKYVNDGVYSRVESVLGVMRSPIRPEVYSERIS